MPWRNPASSRTLSRWAHRTAFRPASNRPRCPLLLQSRANEIYNTTCAACHGTSASQAPAPSLFSQDFLNSRTDAQIVQVLTDGLAHAQP